MRSMSVYWKRHRRRGDCGLVAVGIGWPVGVGKPDSERGVELVFLVKKIKKRPPKHHKNPDEIRAYLTIGNGKRKKKAPG